MSYGVFHMKPVLFFYLETQFFLHGDVNILKSFLLLVAFNCIISQTGNFAMMLDDDVWLRGVPRDKLTL